MRVACLLTVALAAACGAASGVGAVDATPEDAAVARPAIPADVDPCAEPWRWPEARASTVRPVVVHYQLAADAALAADVVALIERAWAVEVDRLGFRPPIADGGACGDDGRLDVFLWPGIDECYVDVIAEVPTTPADDRAAILVLDPWGSFGGPLLPTTVAHELNHVLQAADDWSDQAFIYEATAVAVEDEVWDDDDQYLDQVRDFAAHPDWSIDRDDGYETWFMYGAGQFLRFVRDRYYRGDASFLGALWQGMRAARGGDPDALAALATLLAARGATVDDAMVEFARWRVYTGARADGAHLEEAAAMPEPTRVGTVGAAGGGRVAIAPMTRGTSYVAITAGPGDPAAVTVALVDADPAARWVVQAIPGVAADGDVLAVAAGPVAIDPRRVHTLAITALTDVSGAGRTDRRYAATVVIAPR